MAGGDGTKGLGRWEEFVARALRGDSLAEPPAGALRRALSLGAGLPREGTAVERVALDWGQPKQRWVDRLTLEKAVEALPPGYRIIFQLHDVEGYEHREIAGMMGCSVGNSKSQLHKARMKLREILQLKPAPASEEAG